MPIQSIYVQEILRSHNFRSEAVEFFELVEWRSRIKLRNIKCENGYSIPKYLTKFTQCRDELGSVGVTVDDEDGESSSPWPS